MLENSAFSLLIAVHIEDNATHAAATSAAKALLTRDHLLGQMSAAATQLEHALQPLMLAEYIAVQLVSAFL